MPSVRWQKASGAATNKRFTHGENVFFPSETEGDYIPAIEYTCENPVLALIMCPGSSGGMGPGIAKMHRGLGLEKRGGVAAFGSIYTRLGVELSSGDAAQWDPPLASKADTSKEVKQNKTQPRFACLHVTWRRAVNGVKWPGGKLKRVDSLADAVDDLAAAAAYMARLSSSLLPTYPPPVKSNHLINLLLYVGSETQLLCCVTI